MRNFFTCCQWLIALAAALVWFVGPIYYTTSAQPIAAAATLVTSGLILFLFIIFFSMDRMIKGVALLGLAALTALFYSAFIEPMTTKLIAQNQTGFGSMGTWISVQLGMSAPQLFESSVQFIKTMLYFLNVACTGAGGSIIAVEGDRTSIERSLGIFEKKELKSTTNLTEPEIHSTTDTAPLIHTIGLKMDMQLHAQADLSSKITSLTLQLSTFTEQQARTNRKLWAVFITIAIVMAATISFVIGIVACGRP